jgi:hypothetical protein
VQTGIEHAAAVLLLECKAAEVGPYIWHTAECQQQTLVTFFLQRLAAAEEQYDTGLRKLTATAKQIAALQRQVSSCWLLLYACLRSVKLSMQEGSVSNCFRRAHYSL